MPHPLVRSLKFARTEFLRGLEGITQEEGARRFETMNSISWTIGHLANQENFYWVYLAQGVRLAPGLRKLVGTGQPASTPPLDEMWGAWREITSTADTFLANLETENMRELFQFGGKAWQENIGTLLLRNTHHYWYHLGEGMAVRQLLGHKDLPQFVGNMASGNYQPER
jgi:hypothetical protein